MFELPETTVLARQMDEALCGKTVVRGITGELAHKFAWYNHPAEEFDALVRGKTVGRSTARARFIFTDLEPGYRLVLGECGGKLLYHPPGAPEPKKAHLHLTFGDGSSLTETISMWGAMELYEQGAELERAYIKGMRTTPADPGFTFEYFDGLIDELLQGEKRSVKSLLTQDQLIPGLGNAIAQDILFRAEMHPRHPLGELDGGQRQVLYEAILSTVADISAAGGRCDETDLFGRPGGYARVMDKNAPGKPCPRCGGKVEKIAYLGGACYVCPACQK